MDLIEIRKGCGEGFLIDLTDESTGEPKSYIGTETLACRVWSGDDQQILLTPNASWQTPSTGTIALLITEANTSSLDPGRYYLSLTIVEAGVTREVFSSWLAILPAPGNATPLPTYCAQSDLEALCPRVDLEQRDGMQAGFAEARNLARRWIDSRLINKSFNKKQVKEWLDDDGLIVDQNIIEIATRLSLHFIFSTAFSIGNKEDKFLKYAALQLAKAESLFYSSTFGIDTNNDGDIDQCIDCSRLLMRGYN